MGDELFDGAEEEVGGDESSSGQKKIGFVPGLLIQILKWAGIILAGIIFVVTVVVITVNLLFSGQTARQSRIPLSEEYQETLPELQYYPVMPDGESMRGSTSDQPRQTFIVDPYMGYDGENSALESEIINRLIQIRDLALTYFSSKTADELLGVSNQARVKNELTERINRILTTGRIRDIAFERYDVIGF